MAHINHPSEPPSHINLALNQSTAANNQFMLPHFNPANITHNDLVSPRTLSNVIPHHPLVPPLINTSLTRPQQLQPLLSPITSIAPPQVPPSQGFPPQAQNNLRSYPQSSALSTVPTMPLMPAQSRFSPPPSHALPQKKGHRGRGRGRGRGGRMCHNYARGFCKKGNNCTYSHNVK